MEATGTQVYVRAVEEVKQLLSRDRPLVPRTYRLGPNRTIFIGGVCRIDVTDFEYGTICLTVWASDLIPLHMGKTGEKDKYKERSWRYKADQFWENHVGNKLNPPGPDSKHIVPELQPVEVQPIYSTHCTTCTCFFGSEGVDCLVWYTVWCCYGTCLYCGAPCSMLERAFLVRLCCWCC